MSNKPQHDLTLLQSYLRELQTNPIRTKSYTSATLNALSEILASYFAGERDPQTGFYISARVPKMAIFGFFVSAPINHYLVLNLQKAFHGKKGALSKLGQILAANLFVIPINCTVFVVSMAIIAGARSIKQIIASSKAGIVPVLKASWISSPITLAIAQAFIPEHAWVPFFSLVAFIVGTYNNYAVKKRRQLAAKQEKKSE